MNIKFAIIIAVIIALVSFGVAAYYFFGPFERTVLDVRFSVGDKVGFDTNTSGLIFGTILPGGSSMRTLKYRNDNSFPVRIKVKERGKAAQFLSIDVPSEVGAMQNYTFSASVSIPLNITFGNYSGKVVFETWK